MTVDVEQLMEEYARTKSIVARDKAFEACMPVAHMIAKRFSGRGVEYEDLDQIALMALFKAMERYDSERGVKFLTFATPTMVGDVKNFFRDRSRVIRVPRRSGELMREIDRAREALSQRLSRSPTALEIADELGVGMDEVLETLEMQGALRPVSLDGATLGDDDEVGLHALLGYEEEGYARFEASDMVERALSQLPEFEARVLRERYFNNLSQRDAAKKLGVSQMTVSRGERRAILRVRELIGRANKA